MVSESGSFRFFPRSFDYTFSQSYGCPKANSRLFARESLIPRSTNVDHSSSKVFGSEGHRLPRVTCLCACSPPMPCATLKPTEPFR